MSTLGNKPDVVELARAQLDFAAVNSAAPGAKDILFKAQTIVPLPPSIPWEKYAAGTGVAVLLCALLLLPWVPQRSLVSIAGAQFDELLTPAEAQELVHSAVRGLSDESTGPLLSADYAPQPGGRGLLMIKATSFGERSAQLQQRLTAALDGTEAQPAYAAWQVAEHQQSFRRSPLALAQQALRGAGGSAAPDSLHPAALLAEQVRGSEQVLRAELERELLQHGYRLTGFAFADDKALLPAGCQFKLPAWPQPVAAGVRGYLRMSAFQQDEVQRLAGAWLARMNLAQDGLLLEAQRPQQPIVAEVLGQNGRVDSLLTARLNAALAQPSPQDMAGINFSVERLVSEAAAQVLPGIERRMDFERLSKMGEAPRYSVRITLLGRAELPGIRQAEDPVDNTYVREEW